MGVRRGLHGDFGTDGRLVSPLSRSCGRRIGVSSLLVIWGSVIGTIAGVLLGAAGAIRQYQFSDRLITVLSLLVLSTPTFVMANLLNPAALRDQLGVGLQVFLYTGETSADARGTGWWNQFVDWVQHLVLPTMALALGAMAIYSRYQRNAMLDVLRGKTSSVLRGPRV